MNDFDPDDLSKDEAYRIVVRERRRALVAVLLSTDEGRTVDTLSEEIAQRENRDNAQATNEVEQEEIATTLIHHHLPFLSNRGVIEFNRDDRTVTPNSQLEELIPLVEP